MRSYIKDNRLWLGLTLFTVVVWTIILSHNISTKDELVNKSIESIIQDELGISINDIDLSESKKENADFENIYGYFQFYNKYSKKFEFTNTLFEARITLGSNGGIEDLESVESELWLFNKANKSWYEIQSGNLYDSNGDYYRVYRNSLDKDHSKSNNDTKQKESKNLVFSEIDKKEATSLEQIKQRSRFNLTIKDGADMEYNLYIYSDNEREFNNESTWAGSIGETVYVGHYKIALQKQGEESFHLQDVRLGKKFFNMSRNMVYVADGRQDILVLSQFGSSNDNMAAYFYIKDEKLIRISTNSIKSQAGAKYIEPSIFQTMSYSNSEPGWLVSNYELDYNTGKMVEISSKWFDGNERELGEDHYLKFISESSYIINIQPK